MSKPVIIRRMTNNTKIFIKIDDEYFCVYEHDTFRTIYACDNKLRVFKDIFWRTRYTFEELCSSKKIIRAAICRR